MCTFTSNLTKVQNWDTRLNDLALASSSLRALEVFDCLLIPLILDIRDERVVRVLGDILNLLLRPRSSGGGLL